MFIVIDNTNKYVLVEKEKAIEYIHIGMKFVRDKLMDKWINIIT